MLQSCTRYVYFAQSNFKNFVSRKTAKTPTQQTTTLGLLQMIFKVYGILDVHQGVLDNLAFINGSSFHLALQI